MQRSATWLQRALQRLQYAARNGSVLLGPVLPDIRRDFSGTPKVEVLVPVRMALPALIIALFAPFAFLHIDGVDQD